MLDKHYNPADIEARLYDAWEAAGAFKANQRPDGDPCIVIPPPNVTGSLHMGHALNNTLQDILSATSGCWARTCSGSRAWTTPASPRRWWSSGSWPSGRSTAATWAAKKFVDKRLGLEETESGGMIFNQLKRLGASCDWSRERFTMDEGLSQGRAEGLRQLYKEGLIYKDKRLVNWDPKFETAISDLEVENIEVDGHMWHFKYPLAGGETYEYVEKDEDGNVMLRETRDYISIATTRPETMLGDGAVAVHPSDERYAPIVGKLCEIPVGPKEHRRLIPIITDEYPDPDFGSGAVKITGAHDFNDYQVAQAQRHPAVPADGREGAMRADGAPYAEEAAKAMEIVKSGRTPDGARSRRDQPRAG
jgi:valyl-tRNA synthetase